MARISRRFERLNPPPTRRVPVLIGGGGERKTLRIVAEHADIWHGFSGPDELPHKLDVLRTHCLAAGRDVDEIEISVGVGGLGRLGAAPQLPEVEGEPLRALDATLFPINAIGPDFDLSAVEPWIRWRDACNAR